MDARQRMLEAILEGNPYRKYYWEFGLSMGKGIGHDLRG